MTKQLQLPMDIPPIRRPLVIGIGQKARSGKNAAAEAIRDYALQNGFVRVEIISFADELKELATRFAGMIKKDPPLLQRLGVTMRSFDPDFFVKLLAAKVSAAHPELVLIPDLRFQNEAAWVKLQGGYCIEIIRFNADRTRLVAQDRDPNHESEIALDGYAWDYTVGAGPLDELQEGARQVFDQIHMAAYGCPVNQTDQATEDSDGG